MGAPIVTIYSIDHEYLSNSMKTSTLTFGFDIDVVGWVVCTDVKPFGGIVISGGHKMPGGTTITVTIRSSQLVEGNNEINIYGMSVNGQWTPYRDTRSPVPNTIIIGMLGGNIYGQTILGGR